MWWLGRCPASSFGVKLKVHEPATHNGIRFVNLFSIRIAGASAVPVSIG